MIYILTHQKNKGRMKLEVGKFKLFNTEGDHVGKTLKTPKGGEFKIVGDNNMRGKYKKFWCVCSECKKDLELFPEFFSITPNSFYKGYTPCGCSRSPRWTEYQCIIRINRKCKELGYIFDGWATVYIDPSNTKLRLENPSTGNIWETTSISGFLLRGHKDPSINRFKSGERLTEMLTKDVKSHEDAFMASGTFLEGTKFTRNTTLYNSRGEKVFWEYICPCCSHDEYVKNGVCTGVFTAVGGDLKRGILSCRCSKSYRWSEEQRIYQIQKVCKSNAFTFLDWVECYKGVNTEFTWVCDRNHKCVSNIHSFINKGYFCQYCYDNSQRYSYISKILRGTKVISIKYGITCDYPRRLIEQSNKTTLEMRPDKLFLYDDVVSCRRAEKEIKSLTSSILTKDQMPDGYTESISISHYDLVIRIYKKYGGKEIKLDTTLEDAIIQAEKEIT